MAGQLLPEGTGRNSHHLTSTQYVAQNLCFMSFKMLCKRWTLCAGVVVWVEGVLGVVGVCWSGLSIAS